MMLLANSYSRVHITSNEVFSKILKKHSINDTSYESQADFYWKKTKNIIFFKPNNQRPKTKK
jgi:hypothetical protein